MEITGFLEIAIIGAGLSLLIQYIKAKWGTDTGATKALTIALSLALGAGYYALKDTTLWEPILGILGTASTFWAFLLRK